MSKISIDDITYGADPEIFVFSKKTGKIVPACGLIPGTKDEPFKVPGGAVQVDGVALEFNIDPVKTEEEFVSSINSVKDQMLEMARERNPELDLEYAYPCAVNFTKEVFDKIPEEARILGCEPDMNLQMLFNTIPSSLINGLERRTVAGHVHIGWTEGMEPHSPEHLAACSFVLPRVADALEWIETMNPLTLTRRSLYGDYGAFRPKPYGMEYRGASNFWLFDNDLIRAVYQLTRRGVALALQSPSDINTRTPITDAIRSACRRVERKVLSQKHLITVAA